MKRIAIAFLTTTLITAPALAASGGQSQPQMNQQGQQHQGQNQSQNQKPPQGQNNDQNAQNQQQSAQNDQTLDPKSLPRTEIKQVQQALNKDGFHAGRPDGHWGPETKHAMQKFQQSKQIASNGQLDQQTLDDLGVNGQGSQNGQQNKAH